jgi:hypothetical protein
MVGVDDARSTTFEASTTTSSDVMTPTIPVTTGRTAAHIDRNTIRRITSAPMMPMISVVPPAAGFSVNA